MASVKVILFVSKTLSSGEHPIMLRIIKDRKPTYISTGRSCSKDLWDFKSNTPKNKHPLKRELDILISSKLKKANKTMLNFENDEKYFSGAALKTKLTKTYSKITVCQFLDGEINRLTLEGRIGYANLFKDCKNALMKFTKGKDFLFPDVSVKFLNEFESWFAKRGVVNNSISVYMRAVRTLMNKAIVEGYCPAEIYPFKTYRISKLTTKTAKRALKKEQMKKIIELEVKEGSKLFHTKNYFLFSFYTMGTNFTDLALLKWKDIRDDRMSYVRAKTGVNYNVKMLPPAMSILNYYKENYYQSQTGYVFPILNESHLTPKSINYRLEKMLDQTNQDLKEIAKLAGLDFLLTTYVARHSWGTILKKRGASTSVISEGYGHTNERTTQIYLDSFENETLDEVNELLL